MKPVIYRKDLLYPEESYQIIGAAYDIYNTLGPGHHEKYYERAFAEELRSRKLRFREQAHYPLQYRQKIIGRQYFDFLIEGKIVVELKKGDRFSHRHIEQVFEYLKLSDCSLAILINFGQEGVRFKRIVNVKS